MSYIDQMNVSGAIVDIHDKRVDTIDSQPVSGSGNLITSGAVAQADSNLQTQIDSMQTTFATQAYAAAVGPVSSVNGAKGAITGLVETTDSRLSDARTPVAHNQAASTITAGTFPGQVVANNNTNYTTKQIRNIILSTGDPTGGSNGDIWIKYTN